GILALQNQLYAEAVRLFAAGLAGTPPGVIADEMYSLLEQANFQRHLATRGLVLGEVDYQLALAGNAIAPGFVPKDELDRRVDLFQTLLIRDAEQRRKVEFRERGWPSKDIRQSFRPFLSTPRGGCF